MPRFAAAFALALALFAGAARADDLREIPPLATRVTDTTGTLDATQKQALEDKLAALEKRKGAQIAILMVPSTQPEDIAQYSIRVFDHWALGRKGVDDGLLLIVAKDDHRVRIEPGQGLEGAIPDAIASRVIREYLQPKFRNGDFYGGLSDAVDALTLRIDGEALPPPLNADANDRGSSRPRALKGFDALGFALFAIFFARALFGGVPALPRGGLTAAAGGGAAWLLTGGVLGWTLGLGAVGFVLGLLGGAGGGFANRGGSGAWGGGFGGGLGGGGFGGSFGGGGGGGGFSGGGGISAGGGASGSW